MPVNRKRGKMQLTSTAFFVYFLEMNGVDRRKTDGSRVEIYTGRD